MKLNGFIGPAYTAQSTNVEAQKCINLFPQTDETGAGKNVAALLWRPGLKLFLQNDYVSRGEYTTTESDRLFIVERANLWELFADKTKVLRGTLLSSGGFVGIADNGLQMMLVDGPNGYSYDLSSNTLTTIDGFPAGSTLTYQDGYFIFNEPGTQKFWITGLNDTTVDPLDFSTADGSPDDLLLALSDHRELWLAGPKSIEVWYNSGAELFPFARIDGAFIPHGIVSAQCMFKADNTVAWVGQDDQGKGMIWKASGYQPQRISTYAIEQEIAKYRTLSDCVGWSYQQDGHTYGVWNFPSGNATWVYDFSTQLWHQWAYTGEQGLERARPDMHSRAFGKHIVTDWLNGNVYELDPLTLNDNGTSITKQRVAPYIADELKNLIISKFQLDVQTGFAEDVGSIHGGGQVTDVAVTEVYVNANGAAYFGVSRPLGANFQGVLWSSYTLISSLPSDAVIQGIYPVIIGSGTVDWAESLWQYGTNLSLYNTGGNAFHHPFNPHTQTFTSTEFWDASIGTSLSALSNQTIKMVLNSSIFQNNVHDTAFCTGCGFAIYYTSATPITDPQMPAPFAVPAGQGLAWALPVVATDTDGSTSSYVKITQSQITSNVVTFTADPSAGYVPVVGDLLRGVVGTTIDGGALNDGGFVTVSAATSNTFSYAWVAADEGPVAETGAAFRITGTGGGTGSGYGQPAMQEVVGNAWSNPNNILIKDQQYTTITLTNPPSSDALDVIDIEFGIPSTMDVTGVQINVWGFVDTSASLSAQLIVNGSPVGDVKSLLLPVTYGEISFGSITDWWGITPIPDVNSNLFGVRLIASTTVASATVSLDYVEISLGLNGDPPEPQAMLDWSDDGGHTWSNQYFQGLGKIGETAKRVIWRRLGRTRERLFRLTVTDDVPLALIDAFVDVEEGTS